MTAQIIPLVTRFDASGMTHGEVMVVASSYGWKTCSLQWDGDKIIAKRLSERAIEERLRRYRDVTR